MIAIASVNSDKRSSSSPHHHHRHPTSVHNSITKATPHTAAKLLNQGREESSSSSDEDETVSVTQLRGIKSNRKVLDGSGDFESLSSWFHKKEENGNAFSRVRSTPNVQSLRPKNLNPLPKSTSEVLKGKGRVSRPPQLYRLSRGSSIEEEQDFEMVPSLKKKLVVPGSCDSQAGSHDSRVAHNWRQQTPPSVHYDDVVSESQQPLSLHAYEAIRESESSHQDSTTPEYDYVKGEVFQNCTYLCSFCGV